MSRPSCSRPSFRQLRLPTMGREFETLARRRRDQPDVRPVPAPPDRDRAGGPPPTRSPRGSRTRSSRSRTKPFHDTPLNNPPQSPPEEVEVTDPTHPLFGRRFTVLSISRQPREPRGRVRRLSRRRCGSASPSPRPAWRRARSALPAQNGPGKPSRSSFPWSRRVTRHATAPGHLAGLPQALRQQAIDDITAICAEIIHEHFRTHHPVPPRPPGPHLHPPVQPAPGPHQPGEPPPPVRPPAAGP